MLKWARIGSKRTDTVVVERRGPAAERVELAMLAGVKAGQRAEFDALYRVYHPRLWRFLVHLMRQPEAIEEVLNDTMMVVWLRPSSFDGRSKLSTWIFGIAYRKALKAMSRQDLPADEDAVAEQVDPGPGPEQQLDAAQWRGRLRGALAELSLEHRAVVELCYFHDMAHAEIADIVGCPPETVKTRMFYARRRLRLLLDEPGGPQPGEP